MSGEQLSAVHHFFCKSNQEFKKIDFSNKLEIYILYRVMYLLSLMCFLLNLTRRAL
jgi:hypothetical protein